MAVVLLIASVGAVAGLASGAVMPSAVRDLLSAFSWPGVTAWWLVFPGLFQQVPSSLMGIAFAALANTVLWLMLALSAGAMARGVARVVRALRR